VKKGREEREREVKRSYQGLEQQVGVPECVATEGIELGFEIILSGVRCECSVRRLMAEVVVLESWCFSDMLLGLLCLKMV
jgi:hypothetical protein